MHMVFLGVYNVTFAHQCCRQELEDRLEAVQIQQTSSGREFESQLKKLQTEMQRSKLECASLEQQRDKAMKEKESLLDEVINSSVLSVGLPLG